MPDGMEWWLLIPRPVRRVPADIAAVVILVIATGVTVFAPIVSETPLRIILGIPFVLFSSGYTFIAALFPERGPSPEQAEETKFLDRMYPGRNAGIDGIERIALSFGLSIAIAPLIGLILNFTPFGIRLVPVFLGIGGFTIVVAIAATVRRWNLPAEEQFRVPFRRWYASTKTELFEPETPKDAALNVLLVASVLLAASSVGYAVLVPNQGEALTEFYLLTENESGERVAGNYPTNFTVGDSKPLIVGISNHEHEAVAYTVVVEIQNIRVTNNSTTVIEEDELHRFSAYVEANETWQTQHNVTPTMTGERLRLIYLLYKGTPPTEPTAENAYRKLHLWINVTARQRQFGTSHSTQSAVV